jgi:hypothetical protein
VLFPLADAVLDHRDQAEVCREFANLDARLGEAACLDLARDTLARLADAIE